MSFEGIFECYCQISYKTTIVPFNQLKYDFVIRINAGKIIAFEKKLKPKNIYKTISHKEKSGNYATN